MVTVTILALDFRKYLRHGIVSDICVLISKNLTMSKRYGFRFHWLNQERRKKEEGISNINSTVNSLDDILDRYETTDIQQTLLRKMTVNPNITIAELSTVIGLDRNVVNYQLKKLRKIINIERSGSDKKRSWKISPK